MVPSARAGTRASCAEGLERLATGGDANTPERGPYAAAWADDEPTCAWVACSVQNRVTATQPRGPGP